MPHISVINAAKTVCKHGHSLEGAYVTPQGWRVCKSCRRQRDRERKRLEGREVDLPISQSVVALPKTPEGGPWTKMEAQKAKTAALLAGMKASPAKPILPEPEYVESVRVPLDENGNPC